MDPKPYNEGYPTNDLQRQGALLVMRKLLPYLAAGLLSFPVHATAPVEVVALFKDRAVVRTAAGQQMLKVGETSDFGVTLRAADPYSA